MPIQDYDISQAFAEIENELIDSMIRNMKRHKVEEISEDKQWSMWQAEQLKALEAYRVRNKKKFHPVFKDLNARIDELIRKTKAAGDTDQELEILKAIKKEFKGYRPASDAMQGEFFKLNERKLEALIKATVSDMKKAEYAMLRMANDQYRKIIFTAQTYVNTGAGTYEKAIDMATKDFLSAGINCIEYSNGSRHSVKEYVKMAIRTANTRAYLYGEGEQRKKWGIPTVIVQKRGNPCPKCLPFVGKVLIDDVYSGGSSNGRSPVTGVRYPTLSSAIAAGLYHPNCKDVHTTYFEGISTPPSDSKYTKEELDQLEEQTRQDARQQYAKRQEEKYNRLAKYSLDEENQEKYTAKKEKWETKAQIQPVLEHENAVIDYRAEKVVFKDLNKWKKSIGNITKEEREIIYGMNNAGYIRNSNSYKINKAMREGTVDKLSAKSQKTIETLRGVIDKNVSDMDAVLMRKVDQEYIENVFGIKNQNAEEIVKEINAKKLGHRYIEKGFVSTSYKANKNLNDYNNVILDIYAPKGTKMYLTTNREESEIILQAGTQFEVKGATLTEGNKIKILLDVKDDEEISKIVRGTKENNELLQKKKDNAKIKLKNAITDASAKISELKEQFSDITEGYSYDEWFKEFTSIEEGFGIVDENDESFRKLKEVDQNIKDQIQKKNELLHQKEKRKQLDTGYSGRVPDDELDKFNKEAFEQIKSDTGYSDGKAKEFQEALKEYFGGDYTSILNGETETAKIIRDGIDRMPAYEGGISRGMILSNSDVRMFSDLKKGDELPRRGIIESWTSNKGTAIGYGGISDYERSSVILECEKNETAVGVQHLSLFGTDESEVLSSSKYEVVEVTNESKYDYLSKHREYLYFPEDLENSGGVLKENVVCIIKVKEKV